MVIEQDQKDVVVKRDVVQDTAPVTNNPETKVVYPEED